MGILLFVLDVLFPIVVVIFASIAIFETVQRIRMNRRNKRIVKDAVKEMNENLYEKVANILLEKADDERPIVLNVRQDKLIEKTVAEIERKEALRGA